MLIQDIDYLEGREECLGASLGKLVLEVVDVIMDSTKTPETPGPFFPIE